jgi:hypothetical protein
MDLSPFQRSVAFVAIVIVLVGLGVYLFLPSASGAGSASPGPARPTPSAGPADPPPSNPATSPAVPSASVAPPQPPDIYQWLPFTSAGLASAAGVTVRFGTDYGTFSYSQGTAAYLAPIRPLATSQLTELIGRAYSAPGVAGSRASQKQVSAGSAVITSLRAFGSTSITFVVEVTERITDNAGTSKQTAYFAITLTGAGTSWQVSDIEPSSAGNQ